MHLTRILTQTLRSLRPFSTTKQPEVFRKLGRSLAYPVSGKPLKYVSASEAISMISSNSDIYVQGCSSTPTELVQEMCKQIQAKRLDNLRLSHIILMGDVPWTKPEFYDKVRSNCLFICGATRKLIQEGHADYTCMFLSDIAKLYSTFALPVDVALITVSPPDKHGFCTLGLSADCSIEAVRASKKIIALVNETMPTTFGDTIIHASHIDALVHTKRPIYTVPSAEMGEAEKNIGKLIAENLIEDEATLQMGIGGIPDSVLSQAKGHKNLGVHTELVSDGIVDLINEGVINNTCKTSFQGKTVTSFSFGSRRLYDLIDSNPSFLFFNCGFTNNTEVIADQHKMTAINSAIEVDLTGQIVSESIGENFYSGFGGQVDFIYGTSIAKDGKGKSIIALTSVTSKGESKIVPYLKKGAGVVTTRGHVRYLVTEYGIAQLWGKTIRQRAYELIQIAHPDHRESLEKAAFERFKCFPSRD